MQAPQTRRGDIAALHGTPPLSDRVRLRPWRTFAPVVCAAGLYLASGVGGCARSTSNGWAQTSPILKADASNAIVSLGAR